KIEGRLNGNWQFPPGTVFVKHFDLPLDERQANTSDATSELRRLETRVVVCDDRGAVYAATYRWNAEQTDAELVDNSQTEQIEYVAANGQSKQQSWLYPGRFECLACHNQPAGYVLGFSAKQLNRQVQYADGDGHQLQRFANARLLDMPCNSRKLRRLPEMASIDDPEASLETRVRSYLDAN